MGTNLIKKMKERIAKSGASKKEILYFGKDSVKRIRFLQELDQGYNFQFHSNWDPSIYELCQDPEDHEDCKCCKDGIAIQDEFVWSVWSYDDQAVRLLKFKASGVSPIPSFIEMFEEFGTITDRDYKVKKVGQGMGGSFVVTPLDKERFKIGKAKPYTEKQILEIFKEAFKHVDKDEDEDLDDEVEEEEEDEKPSKKYKKASKKKREKSLKDKYLDLDFEMIERIAKDIGVSKKEIRNWDEDVEEGVEYLFDEYEESDLEDILNDLEDNEDIDDD